MSTASTSELTFEQALAELEKIVRDLEDGQTGLEDSLGRYEQGVCLLKCCYAQLAQAEQRILTVTGLDEAGRPITHPFEHTATADSKPKLRGKKLPPD